MHAIDVPPAKAANRLNCSPRLWPCFRDLFEWALLCCVLAVSRGPIRRYRSASVHVMHETAVVLQLCWTGCSTTASSLWPPTAARGGVREATTTPQPPPRVPRQSRPHTRRRSTTRMATAPTGPPPPAPACWCDPPSPSALAAIQRKLDCPEAHSRLAQPSNCCAQWPTLACVSLMHGPLYSV